MLTQEQVKHLATLARLKLSPAEVESYARDLDGIVGYVDLIREIPASAFEGVALSGLVPEMPLRPSDAPGAGTPPRDLLACSPKKVVGTQVMVAATKG